MPKPPKIPPIAAAIADAVPLPDVATTRTGLTHGLERDTLRSSNATKRTRQEHEPPSWSDRSHREVRSVGMW